MAGSIQQLEKESAHMVTELATTGEVLRDLREDRGRLLTLEQQSLSTNGAVMRMEEMMMRVLTSHPPSGRTSRMDEIEREIETMRLTHNDTARKGMSERTLIRHNPSSNV